MMTPEAFLTAIGIELFAYKERDLQDYIINVLQESDYSIEDEVVLGGGRSDIIAKKDGDYFIFEVKKYLEASYIYQALGQALSYRNYLQENIITDSKAVVEIIVIGLAPSEASKYKAAINRADYITQLHKDCSVIFINEDERFYPNNVNEVEEEVSLFDIIKCDFTIRLGKLINVNKQDLFVWGLALIIVFAIIEGLKIWYKSEPVPKNQIERRYEF